MINSTSKNAFGHLPRTPRGHFVLHLYAAVFRLLAHISGLSAFGGQKLEQVFERYPFLAKYYEEMKKFMPAGSDWTEAAAWWRDEITAWEEQCSEHLPLAAIGGDGTGFEHRIAFMIAGLVEEDSRFGTVFAELQAPLGARRPTLELVGQVLMNGESPGDFSDPGSICRPLLDGGFIEVMNRQAPRSEWVLRVPPLLWDAARGGVSGSGAAGFHLYSPDAFPLLSDLIYPPDFLGRLDKVPELITAGRVRTLVLRSDYGADPLEVIGALCRKLKKGVIAVEGKAVGTEDTLQAVLGPLCAMTGCIPAFRHDLGPGESIPPPILTGYDGPVCLLLGLEGGLTGRVAEKVLTLSLPVLDKNLRKRSWLRACCNQAVEHIEIIIERYHVSAGYIRQLADIAAAQAGLDGREAIRLEDVQAARRTLNRQHLDTLADRLETTGSWADLVTTETTGAKLGELEQRCRNREQLLDRLGPAFGNSANRGVRALFSGASGTGKTLAAKILASELGMDLYRVDLASIINKYIGETEKNLHRVLSRAEALDVVLLLDEGDALLGARTDVKTANDRYANLETNYLLQRLENYQGIVIVTTNLVENVDRAFQRRMDVVVPFLPPQAEQRLRILEIHLPPDHAVDDEYLRSVAVRCPLTGGQLRNAVLHATLLALDARFPLDRRYLEEALSSEFRKAGAIFPLEANGSFHEDHDCGMASFIDALRSHN